MLAPCCEPAALVVHQPIMILLLRVADIPVFLDWTKCRELDVEHGCDGVRVLSLMELARRFESEQSDLNRIRKAGLRTRHHETMYLLDLALDTRIAKLPTKKIPWGRFENVLQEMNLE